MLRRLDWKLDIDRARAQNLYWGITGLRAVDQPRLPQAREQQAVLEELCGGRACDSFAG